MAVRSSVVSRSAPGVGNGVEQSRLLGVAIRVPLVCGRVHAEGCVVDEDAPVHLGKVDDENSVFSFHSYCITTSLIPDASFGCDLNADVVFGNAADYAQAHNIPALLTEFGADAPAQPVR